MQTNMEYFESRVVKTEGCWDWPLSVTAGGYGVTSAKRMRTAHRLSYSLYKGDIADDMQIDHLCSRPSCGNPDHLDQVMRIQDGARRRIRNHWRGWASHCARGHEMTDVTTRWRPNGDGRQCRVCQHERMSEYRQRNGGNPYPPFDYSRPSDSLRNKWMYRPSAEDYDLADIDLRFVEYFWRYDPMHSSSMGTTQGKQPKGAYQK